MTKRLSLFLVFTLFSLTPLLASTNVPITVIGTTNTQALISYIAPDSGACTVAASPTNSTLVPEVYDLDTSLFTNANSDILRSDNLQIGLQRFTLIGRRGESTASNGLAYSLAIAAGQAYTGSVSCDSGAYIGSFAFTTDTIRLGNAAPDIIPYDSNQWMGWGWPTINYTTPTNIVDPLTGVILARWTSPSDEVGNGAQNECVSNIVDQALAWTNISNIKCASNNSTFASYSGSAGGAASLFLWGEQTGIYGRPSFMQDTWTTADDIQVTVTGYGSDGSEVLGVCLSYNFGQTCFGNTLSVTLPASTESAQSIPSSYPAPEFQGWGSPGVTMDMISNGFGGQLASISGSTVTWQSNTSANISGPLYFPTTVLKPGSAIQISGTSASGCNSNNICTIASVQSPTQLTLNQTITSWTPNSISTLNGGISSGASTFTVNSAAGFIQNAQPSGAAFYPISFVSSDTSVTCTTLSGNVFSGCSGISSNHSNAAAVGQNLYTFPNWGVKVWKQSGSGTVNIDSIKTQYANSNGFWNGYQGSAAPYCSSQTITVTSGPAAGQAYVCFFASQYGNVNMYAVNPSNGQSNHISQMVNIVPIPGGTDPSTFFVFNTSTNKIGQCSYSGTWAPIAAYSSSLNPGITCTYTLSNSITSEVSGSATWGGSGSAPIDQTYFTPGSPFYQDSYCPNGPNSSPCDFLFMFRPVQGSFAWFCTADVSISPGSSQIVNCYNSWDTYPLRWATEHGGPYYIGKFGGTAYVFSSGLNTPNQAGNPGTGPWQMGLNSITGISSTTAMSNSYTDSRTCKSIYNAEGGSGDIPAYLSAQIAGGGENTNNCIEINIDNDPREVSPPSGDLTALGGLPVGSRPYPCSWNTAFACLQSIQPGDGLLDAADINAGSQSNGEIFVVINRQVTGGTINLELIRGTTPFNCNSTGKEAHSNNWIPVVYPPQSCGEEAMYIPNASAPSTAILDNPTLFSGHVGEMGVAGSVINYEPGSYFVPSDIGSIAYAVRSAQIPSGIGSGFSYPLQNWMPFQGNFTGLNTANLQSHPGEGALSNPIIFPDGRPIGGAGGGQTSQWSQTASLVSGQSQTYLIGVANNSATNIYSLSTFNIKTRQIFAFAGYHLLYDISSPTSVINDSKPWSACIAYNAGECVAGSTQWNVYEVVPSANISGTCMQDGTQYTPCFTLGPNVAGSFTQNEVDQPDYFGQFWRNETFCLNGPNRNINYANMHGLTTGDWNVCPTAWGNGQRADIFGVYNPPWVIDSSNRSYYTLTQVSTTLPTGTSIRARFGYGPNLYCSSRLEQCSTAVPSADSDPYVYVGETQQWTTCTTGVACAIQIPSISGRMLYYILDQKVGSNITSGPMNIIPVN